MSPLYHVHYCIACFRQDLSSEHYHIAFGLQVGKASVFVQSIAIPGLQINGNWLGKAADSSSDPQHSSSSNHPRLLDRRKNKVGLS